MNEQQTATATVAAPPDAIPAPVTASSPAPDATPAPVTADASANANAPAAVEPDYRAMYENLRRENEILRQNAQNAQSAPVQGVSGGGAVSEPADDFLRGFDSDTW